MTSEKELKLSYDELTRLVWVCPGCRAEQGLDISSEEQIKKLHTDRFFKCGICGSSYDSSLLQALQSLSVFYDEMKKSRSNVFFRVSMKNKSEEDKI